jgi:hypothetical protein
MRPDFLAIFAKSNNFRFNMQFLALEIPLVVQFVLDILQFFSGNFKIFLLARDIFLQV